MKRKGRLITVKPKKPTGRVWPQNVAPTAKEAKEKLASIRDKK
jgi:hypothetical protein